ncbi:hypothetical protein PXO_05787 [Xanthomonas oryzae pv. oryzae PXO99A]|uniref:Uncharacterized protein n=1 Tax=Xanthomonas oryzae pv. oryzae (strain PXO99A) TaxID=360094 RepID=A0A0K0GRB0_XANOP|nr:hypothetical protein PXO_05787 [Xanthomonas oryzae pv. oryzae PXO99A]
MGALVSTAATSLYVSSASCDEAPIRMFRATVSPEWLKRNMV